MRKEFYLISILLLVGNFYPIFSQVNQGNYRDILNYTSHSPININDDLDFVGYAFPGSGGSGDPYRIENFIFSDSSSYGINIEGVTKYFVIRNCYIENKNNGIQISDVNSGRTRIENTICINNNDNGIEISNCGTVRLIDNRCENNGEIGIYIYTCSGSILTNNTCINNDSDGIYVRNSDTSHINENKCHNNDIGIYIKDCASVECLNNEASNNGDGLNIAGCSNSEISNNNIYQNQYYGLSIGNSDQVNVENNICFDNEQGIYVGSSEHSYIYNNTCYDNGWYGISLGSSYYSTISFNNLTGNSLEIDESMLGFYYVYTLQNNTVNGFPFGFFSNMNNEIITEEYGQLLLVNCTKTTIENKNLISIKLFDSPECMISGCLIEKGYFGIHLIESIDTKIMNNTIINCGYDSIYIEHSERIIVQNNTISGAEWGIDLSHAPNSEIIENAISNVEICMFYDCSFSKISNNTVSTRFGFSISETSNLNLRNNYFLKGGFAFYPAIDIIQSSTILNNTILGKPIAIYNSLSNEHISQPLGQLFLLNSENIIIENQNFNNVPYGVYFIFCDDCTLQNSTCINIYQTAAYITNSTKINITSNILESRGSIIELLDSPYTVISQNTIKNGYYGIRVNTAGSGNSLITNNLIKNNTRYGIEISSDNNKIHHNNFIDNNIRYGTSQANDKGNYNQWYDASKNEGNYWNDWSSSNPYSIDGGSIDPYPLITQAPITIKEYSTSLWIFLLGCIVLVLSIPVFRLKKEI